MSDASSVLLDNLREWTTTLVGVQDHAVANQVWLYRAVVHGLRGLRPLERSCTTLKPTGFLPEQGRWQDKALDVCNYLKVLGAWGCVLGA
ncbi:hypothetical protein E2562_025464 [Oryza meyeriana var. granulata]|uniref:Uncharacterized protein n=1 Tax=Oryza meyeriana var. granulata TaxID=110450 RepID=A0A6G1D868_9ORYZ|nr:hypothetical protein E2562_025464 [Oryza meyeriana var. granulata]